MKKRSLKRKISLLLVVALVVTSFPAYVFGYANTEDATQPVVATEETKADSIEAESGIKYDPDFKGEIQIVDELTSKRGEFEKHFVRSDGSAVAISYPQQVHYKADGVWTDIDSRLVLKDKEKGLYGPASSDLKVSLPGTATADILVPASGDSKASVIDISSSYLTKITDGDYSISWNILGNSKDYTSDFLSKAKTDTLSGAQTPSSALTKDAQPDISKLSHDEQMTALPNLFSTATYKDVIKNVDVDVTVTPDKLKENLIIKSPKDFTSVSYLINAGSLIGKISEDNSVIFTNDKDEVVFTIPTPLMLDSNTMPEESLDIAVALEKSTQGYILTLTPDSKWMNDPARVYPVILDPTVKTTQSQANIMETYIHSGDTAGEHYTSSYIRIGDTDIAICRGYVDFAAKPTINTDLNDITGGSFIGYLVDGTSTYHEMRIYQTDDPWSASTITWANRPTNTYLDAANGSPSGDYFKYTFDVESSVKNWYATGEQNGYMIKYTDETINDYNWFYSSDHPTISTSYYTCLSIVYAPDAVDPTLSTFTVAPVTSSSNYSTDETPTLTWTGANDLHFKEMQYAVGSGTFTKISTAKAGSYTLPTGKLSPGANVIKLHAVDYSGNFYEKTVTYYWDNVSPTLSVSPASSTTWKKSPVLLTATGTDANSGIDTNSYRFNGVASTLTPSNTYSVTTPGANSISISVSDNAGNETTIPSHQVYIDNSSPVISSITAAKSDGTNITLPGFSTYTNPVIKLNNITDTYSGLRSSGNTYAIRPVGSSDALSYVALPAPVGANISATIPITTEGSYNIYFKVLDIVGNETNTNITYTLDRVAPVLGTISITPATTPITPTTVSNPTITWGTITEPNLASVQYKVDSGSYVTMGTSSSGSYTLPANSITSEGLHTITIKAIDKAGNFVESTPQYYSVDDSLVLDSNTYIGTATLTNYYGKNLIHWNPPATIPSQVYYKVYRGTTPNFTMDSSTLLAADLKTSYYIDMNIGGTGTYYYKVKVVKKNIYGQEVAYDAVSSEMIGSQKSASEFSAGIGQNFYMDYFTFGTPSGNGYVEKRYGNLGYSQQDFTLSNMEFDYGLTRTYNSQSENTGMLGKGWSDSYHQEIYKNSDGKYYFRQGDGTTYTFALVSGSTYKCEQTKEYSITVNSVPNQGVMYVISTKDNTVYDFNVYGQLIKASKPTGVGLNYEYDSYGRLANVISINGLSQSEKSISMNYSQTSPYTLSKIVLPDSSERLYSVSPTGQLDVVTFSRGGFTGGGTTESVVYNYGYDTNGLLNQIKDGELNSYSIEYASGKASKVTYPNSEYFQIGYALDGNQNTINTVTKKYGSSEFYSEQAILDAATGKILARTGASGLLTEYTYLNGQTENHLLLEKTTAQKSYETLDLGSGNIGFATTPTVEINDIVYNSDENVIEESVSLVTGQTTTTATTNYEYNDEPDQNPNLISAVTEETTITKGGSSATTVETVSVYVYNEEGRIISETTDPEPETVIFEEKDGYSATQYDYAFNTVAGPYTATESVFIEGETVASQISTTTLDAEGNPTASISEAGAAENLSTIVCDEMGRVTLEEEKDPENTSNIIRTTTHAYDYLGREISVTSVQDGLTTTTTNSYNKNNSLVSTTDDLGITSTYTFDSLNRETSRTTIGGSLSGGSTTTSYGYEYFISLPDQISLPTIAIVYKETTTENGQTKTKWTDGNGNLIKEESGGATRYFKYDQSGNQVLEFIQGDANNAARASMTLYDQKGNLFANIQNPEISTGNPATYSISAESILTRTLYYDNGKVKAQIDGKGVITHFTYDTMDRVVGITEDAVLDGSGNLTSGAIQNSISYPDQFTTSTSNGEGTLNTKIVDAAGLTTQVITSDEDDSNVKIGTTFIYDQQGRLTKETYQDNTFKTYEYNCKGQLVSISTYIPNTQVPEEPIEQTRAAYTYNSDNQKTGEIDYKLNVQGAMTAHHYEYFEYDSLGRVSGVIALNQNAAPTPAAKESHKTSYAYNAAGQVTEITYPLNTADEVKGLEYVYDGDGRITEVNAKLGTETKPLRTYGYDCFGEVSEITDIADFTGTGTNAVERTYIYDIFGRVTSMQYVNGNTTLESFALTYDDNSNITSEVDGSLTKSYSYDDLGRLTTVQTSSATTNYTYDNAGNRITKTTGEIQTNYSYNDLNQLTSSTENTKDQNDNYTQLAASSTYTYDSKGNLTQDIETRGSVVTEVDNSFTVDSMLSETTILNDSQTTLMQANSYNGNGQRISKTENDTLSNYFYQGSNVLYSTDSTDTKTSQNFLTPGGGVIETARYAPSDISYYLYNKDIRNSTTSIVDENAGFASKYSYDEFGITSVDGSYTFANEICFTGGFYDWSSGQYYLNARYYDPQIGRFLSEDTYRGNENNPNSWHLYVYCASNPINYMDPSGHWGLTVHQSITYWKYSIFTKTQRNKLSLSSLLDGSTAPDRLESMKGGRAHPECHGYHGSYQSFANKYLQKALIETDKEKKSYYLGIGLHTLQDYYSHNIWIKNMSGKKILTWYGAIEGYENTWHNKFDSVSADYTSLHVGYTHSDWTYIYTSNYPSNPRIVGAGSKTYNFLKYFLDRI